jgi:hypothetical protein
VINEKEKGLSMNSIDFCFWLQGYFEISGNTVINAEQAGIIKDHLNLVFKHEIDPLREIQTIETPLVLNQAHGGKNDGLVRC